MEGLNSQIATTREQSERFLAMGMKPETADMHYSEMPTADAMVDMVCRGVENEATEYVLTTGRGFDTSFPAWSLSRLYQMLPSCIYRDKGQARPYHPILNKVKSGYILDIRDFDNKYIISSSIRKNPIECFVEIIEWLINNNHFNEEYYGNTGHKV